MKDFNQCLAEQHALSEKAAAEVRRQAEQTHFRDLADLHAAYRRELRRQEILSIWAELLEQLPCRVGELRLSNALSWFGSTIH